MDKNAHGYSPSREHQTPNIAIQQALLFVTIGEYETDVRTRRMSKTANSNLPFYLELTLTRKASDYRYLKKYLRRIVSVKTNLNTGIAD